VTSTCFNERARFHRNQAAAQLTAAKLSHCSFHYFRVSLVTTTITNSTYTYYVSDTFFNVIDPLPLNFDLNGLVNRIFATFFLQNCVNHLKKKDFLFFFQQAAK